MLVKLCHSVNLNLIKQGADESFIFHDKTTLNQPNGDFFYDSWSIKDEYKNTLWDNILKTLPYPHGEARIIVLYPATCYQSHADIDDRYHLNIQSEESYFIDLENNVVHKIFQDGFWYEMDAGRLHSAANLGRIHRVQLVVRKLLIKNKLENPIRITITSDLPLDDQRFEFDQTASKWLNRANKLGKISDFKLYGNIVEFFIEKNEISQLSDILGKNFIIKIV